MLSTPLGVQVTNSSFELRANRFAVAHVYGASYGASSGDDTAIFQDTSDTERLIGRPSVSQWNASSYQHWAHNFATVVANSSGGGDTATLYDSGWR